MVFVVTGIGHCPYIYIFLEGGGGGGGGTVTFLGKSFFPPAKQNEMTTEICLNYMRTKY